MSNTLTGIAASAGIAIAKAFVHEEPDFTVKQKEASNKEKEVERLTEALAQSTKELEEIKQKALKELGEDKAEIFSAHLLVLSDPELIDSVKGKINDDGVTAEYALNEVANLLFPCSKTWIMHICKNVLLIFVMYLVVY